jgi:hypothetical protein
MARRKTEGDTKQQGTRGRPPNTGEESIVVCQSFHDTHGKVKWCHAYHTIRGNEGRGLWNLQSTMWMFVVCGKWMMLLTSDLSFSIVSVLTVDAMIQSLRRVVVCNRWSWLMSFTPEFRGWMARWPDARWLTTTRRRDERTIRLAVGIKTRHTQRPCCVWLYSSVCIVWLCPTMLK